MPVFTDGLQPHVKQYYERFIANGRRATTLVEAAEIERSGHSDDLLRAAVVFLHSTLEDLLRTLLSDRAEKLDPAKLSALPLLGMDYTSRKASLHDLLAHKEKKVGDLISESVRNWLQRTSFNEVSDITGVLTSFGVKYELCKPYFSDTEAMIKRRHQIVHNADMVETNNVWVLDTIDAGTVRTWASAVVRVAAGVMTFLETESRNAPGNP